MVDEIHRKGSDPANTAVSDEEHAYSTGAPDFYRNLALADGGHNASFAHVSAPDQNEEKEKREEARDFLRSLINQALIDDLESRNDDLYKLIREAKEELQIAEQQREEILPRLKAAEEELRTCDKDRHEAEKILQEIREKTKEARDLKWEALKAVPDDVLPDHLVQITFEVKNDKEIVGTVQVAVYQQNGKYYFINPLTEHPQEVTDEKQKAELEQQLKDSRKKTYDTESEDMQHRIEHLHEVNHNLMIHVLHTEKHEAELEKAEDNYQLKQTKFEEQDRKVRELKEQLQGKDDQIKELKDKIYRHKDELDKNKAQLEKLYKEREELHISGQQEQLKLKESRKELYQSIREHRDAATKYLEALEAGDEYTTKLKETWKSYQDCKKDERALREMGVALVSVIHHDPAHPDSHAHMVHTVHRDENGYYYLDGNDLRQDLNANSITQGTKAVEDFSGDPRVTEALRLYDHKAHQFHNTLHEFEQLNKEAESLEDIEQKRKKPQSASDVLFSNEKPLAPGLTQTGVFAEAAGQPYAEPSTHEHHHAPAAIPPKNAGPATS
jgi:myosin heavy subunit